MREEELIGYEEMLEYYSKIYNKNSKIRKFLIQIDKPIIYKELTFYPVPIKLNAFFQIFASCLVIPQHKVPDIEILKMKYLDFLFYLSTITKENSNIINLKELLLMCLRLPRTFKSSNGEDIETVEFIELESHWYIKIYNETYNGKDFDNIRKIICEQNLLEMPDSSISDDIEKKYEEYIEHLRKIGKIKTGNLEDLSLCIMAELGITKEEVLNLSIKTFYKLLQRIGFIMEYKITNLLAPYLKEGTLNKLPNWTDEIKKKSKMEEMSADLQDIESKLSGAQ